MDTNFQLMEDYLKGKLDQEGKQLFDSKLKNEPEFETAFREMKAIQDGAKLSAKLSTLKQLEKIEASIQSQETTKIEFNMKKLVSVAASLVLIATVSYFTVFNTPNVASGQEIFTEYYELYPNLNNGAVRGENVEIESLSQKAFFAYDNRDFAGASTLFESLLESEKSALNYLYAGISNLEAGDFVGAKENLNTVSNYYSEYAAQGQWFLAMTLLKEENSEEAVSSLVGLSIGNSEYAERSSVILEKMGVEISATNSSASTEQVRLEPDIPGDDSPDGAAYYGLRQIQFGRIITPSGERLRFFNENPIPGLQVGDQVLYVSYKVRALNKRSGKKKRYFKMAYLIDKI